VLHLRASLLIAFFLIVSSHGCFARGDARVTQLIRDVSLLAGEAAARPALLNESVPETSAVKTGGESRAELTFADQTITRLGAHTLYRFKNAGRQVEWNSGAILLRVPKDSGGATLVAPAVSVGVTGTTLIFENISGRASRLTVLEGAARLTLLGARDQQRTVAAGQSLDVPAGAARVGQPRQIDLAALMKSSPLIVGFRPLPSQNLINNAIRQQQQQQPRGPTNQNQRPGSQSPQNNGPPPGPGPR
jgi:hypothetical protein